MNQAKKTRKKIFLITPSFAGGGAERVYITLATALHRQYPDELDVTLVALSATGPLREQVPADIKLIDLLSPRARQAIFKLRKLIQEEQPDVLLTTLQATTAYYFSRFLLQKKPKWIARLENPFSVTCSKLHWSVRWLFKKALASSDLIISLNQEMTNDLLAHTSIEKEKVKVIYNPIDIEMIRQASNEFSPELQHPALVACGRLSEQKGFSYAIRAMSQVVETHPTAHLYILGEGKKRAELETLIAELQLQNNVSLLGFQDNPYPYFKHADIFVMSSLWEGLPMVLIEVASCRTAILSTDCKTGPAEILQDGKCGIVVKPQDHQAFAENVLLLINDNEARQRYEFNACRRAIDFDIGKIVAHYKDIFVL